MAVRILWCSPLPPTRSGVSDYAVELLRPLCRRAEVRILSPPGPHAPQLPGDVDAEVAPAGADPLPGEIPLVHLGNNPHHLWLIDRCHRDDPVIVVHDLVLHHLLVEHARVSGDPRALEKLLTEDHPAAGSALPRAREFGIHGRLDPFLFPGRKALLAGARALITHSKWGETTLRREFPTTPVQRLGLAAADPGIVDRSALRNDLGVAENELLVMHLGFLTREKGLESVLAAVAAARECGVPAKVLLLGDSGDFGPLERAADACGLSDVVSCSGWVAWEEMIALPAAADLGVVMRVPSAGETSSAVVRFLACGTPVAVIGQRQFLEWPELAAPRITPGPSAEATIARLLVQSAQSGEWQTRRAAARDHYLRHHVPEAIASNLVAFLSSL